MCLRQGGVQIFEPSPLPVLPIHGVPSPLRGVPTQRSQHRVKSFLLMTIQPRPR
jgi:hypothetical protein